MQEQSFIHMMELFDTNACLCAMPYDFFRYSPRYEPDRVPKARDRIDMVDIGI